MRAVLLFLFFIAMKFSLYAQLQDDTINVSEVSRIINILASDSLKGRGNLQPGLLKAASFIGNEFSSIGLKPFDEFQNYFIPFYPLEGKNKINDSIIRNSNNLPIYTPIGYNIVGILPGRSKPGEIIIVSSHYDHEGVFALKDGDSILNGANDNASGTTGVLMLAKYFAKRNDNERTLMFCTFSGEELGLKGSYDFIKYINPDKITACINLEMIGIPQFGAQKVFITGRGYSSLYTILSKNLTLNGIKIIPEPDLNKELFRRSDNYPFVLKKVPAHTIMASDDDDPCYHQPCDETGRIDIANMTAIIKAISNSMRVLISGEETPGRSRR